MQIKTNFDELCCVITMAKLWLEEEGRKNYYFERENLIVEKLRGKIKTIVEEEDSYELYITAKKRKQK